MKSNVSTFKDAEGREWAFTLRLSHLPRLKAAGCDLSEMMAASSGGGVVRVIGLDPRVLGTSLWILCERQAEALGVTPEQFAEGFDGDAVEAARRALLDAALVFMQPPGLDKLREKMPQIVDGIDASAGEWIDKALAEELAGRNSPPVHHAS